MGPGTRTTSWHTRHSCSLRTWTIRGILLCSWSRTDSSRPGHRKQLVFLGASGIRSATWRAARFTGRESRQFNCRYHATYPSNRITSTTSPTFDTRCRTSRGTKALDFLRHLEELTNSAYRIPGPTSQGSPQTAHSMVARLSNFHGTNLSSRWPTGRSRGHGQSCH